MDARTDLRWVVTMDANPVPGPNDGRPEHSRDVDHVPDAAESDPGEADPAVRRLVASVDQLTDLDAQPVSEHAARFREVHNVLQDALSDTDGNGPQPS